MRFGAITGALIMGAISSLFLKATRTPRRTLAAAQRRTRKSGAHPKPARKK